MPDRRPAAALTASDFADFYRAVHGHQPFGWQVSVVAEVLATGRWPDLVDVPTGLGKTSMIDVAVFVAAATAHRSGEHRLGRRRCFFVVDRRIVVDEAHDHALHLQRRLEEAAQRAGTGILGAVATALRAYAPDAGSGPLLSVTRMRGGVTWSSAWLDRPDRPGIILGTVDQVGSRLLFRGYGVSDRRRPIDAALVGTDALLLVDEAHLSTALLRTVSAVQERDRLGLPVPPLSVVRLSATGEPGGAVFTLDVDAHRSDEEAWRRLTADKRLTLAETTGKDCPRVLADTAVAQLAVLAGTVEPDGTAPTALVVCNTVDRARAVHALLTKQLQARGASIEADCELLIGRSRPVDRTGLHDRILDRFGTDRTACSRAAVLVATQTVEVGVNLDADVLVTESASWEALVQRLGRLNRLGRFARRFPQAGPAAAIVVHDGQDDGPVYGAARDATWGALRAVVAAAPDGGTDVSPLACRILTRASMAGTDLNRAPADVPVLLRPTLDAWAQTSPVPLNDPPIEPFLHGFTGGAAAVQVVWREGLLDDAALDDSFADPFDDDDDGAPELAAAQIDALLTQWPLRVAETVEVPFFAVRQWLSGQVPEPVGDVESAPDGRSRPRQVREPFRALVRRPAGDRLPATGRHREREAPDTPTTWRWITAAQVRPGDQLVVPVERGGLDGFGWAPADRTPVRDMSEIVSFQPGRSRRDGMLRLDRGLPARLGLPDPQRETVGGLVRELIEPDDESESVAQRLDRFGPALVEALPPEPTPGSCWPADAWAGLRRWAGRGRLRLVEVPDLSAALLDGSEPPVWARIVAGPVPPAEEVPDAPSDPVQPDRDDEEVTASSISTAPITLAAHHAAVSRRAGQIAQALGLPDAVCDVVRDAAAWHDLGKVEPRFQVMLHGGDAFEAALAMQPLAKSGLDPADRLAWRRAGRLAGLPPGARHEAWSAALVAEHLRQRANGYGGDGDLLVHLIASHHGYARPLARLVVDPAPRPIEAVVDGEKVTVDSSRTVCLDQPARFARLNDRYGRWGLALLEAIVRCADTTVSGEGS